MPFSKIAYNKISVFQRSFISLLVFFKACLVCAIVLAIAHTIVACRSSEKTPADKDVFVLIPAGGFQMGDAIDHMENAPVHLAEVDAFYIAKHEVTKARWDDVKKWGKRHGYTDLPSGSGKEANHPLHSVNWYAMVKWCNAMSERDELTPCYTVSGGIYRTGKSEPACNWRADGYRLPTETEWEKAARGGTSGKRYPWGDNISTTEANYHYSGNPWARGSLPWTSPVGSYPPNPYGLYDMTGNVWEWCWDWYGSMPEKHGPTDGMFRIARGGGWGNDAKDCRVAIRNCYYSEFSAYHRGFRVVRSAIP
jgi:sulfatase modifying factor 1